MLVNASRTNLTADQLRAKLEDLYHQREEITAQIYQLGRDLTIVTDSYDEFTKYTDGDEFWMESSEKEVIWEIRCREGRGPMINPTHKRSA